MGIVSNAVRRVEIPHEPGEWMELRRLSWRQLEQASDMQTNAALGRMKAMGGDLLQALRSTTQEQKADPESAYDRGAVLRMGIARWSYDAPVSPETVNQLDEATAAWAFRAILALHAPLTEEQRKNASPPST